MRTHVKVLLGIVAAALALAVAATVVELWRVTEVRPSSGAGASAKAIPTLVKVYNEDFLNPLVWARITWDGKLVWRGLLPDLSQRAWKAVAVVDTAGKHTVRASFTSPFGRASGELDINVRDTLYLWVLYCHDPEAAAVRHVEIDTSRIFMLVR